MSLATTEGVRRRVLVIEDDPSIMLGLRINLEAEGYEVLSAEDGGNSGSAWLGANTPISSSST